jgi:S1-C subfamily serine protease
VRRTAAALLAGVALAAGLVALTRSGSNDPAPRLVTVSAGLGPAAAVATGFEAGSGRVVTVAHVLDAGGAPAVILPGGARRRARVTRVDRNLDLAVLSVPGLPGRVPATAAGTLGAARLLLRGSTHGTTVRRLVAVTVRTPATGAVARRPALELAGAVDPGDSGAPVVARGGRIIGVVFATSSARAGVAWAVDGSALRALLR